MGNLTSLELANAQRVAAPDGSSVRVLLALDGGSMACFELPGGVTTRAVVHRTVEELWFVRAGHGEIWRKHGDAEDTTQLAPGVCVSIPVGAHFQFRAADTGPLEIVGVTMPPWPGAGEAAFVTGPWTATENHVVGDAVAE